MENPVDTLQNSDNEELINKDELHLDKQHTDFSDNELHSVTNEREMDDSDEHSNHYTTKPVDKPEKDDKNEVITEAEEQDLVINKPTYNLELSSEEIFPKPAENIDTSSQNICDINLGEKRESQNNNINLEISGESEADHNFEPTESYHNYDPEPYTNEPFKPATEQEFQSQNLLTDLNYETESYITNDQFVDKSEIHSIDLDEQKSENYMTTTDINYPSEVTSLPSENTYKMDENNHERILKETIDDSGQENATHQYGEEDHIAVDDEYSTNVSEHLFPQEQIGLTELLPYNYDNDNNNILHEQTAHDLNNEVYGYHDTSNTSNVIQMPFQESGNIDEIKVTYDISSLLDQPDDEDEKVLDSLVEFNENKTNGALHLDIDNDSLPDYSEHDESLVVEKHSTMGYEFLNNENADTTNINSVPEEPDIRTDFITSAQIEDDSTEMKLLDNKLDNIGELQQHLELSNQNELSDLHEISDEMLNNENSTEIDKIENPATLSYEEAVTAQVLSEENDLEKSSLLYATENLNNELQIVEHLTDDRPEPLNITVDIQNNELCNARMHKNTIMECYLSDEHSDDEKSEMNDSEMEAIQPSHFTEHQAIMNGFNERIPTPDISNNEVESAKLLDGVCKKPETSKLSNDVDEISLNSDGEQRTEFEQRYAELIAKYLPVNRQASKNDRSRRTKTLDRYSKSLLNENRYSYIDATSDSKKRAVTLERNEFRRKRRIQPKPSINDDYMFPDSVTPSKVDKSISVRSLEEGIPEGTYDVPYIDDDAFLPRRLRENKGDENESDEGSSLSLEESYWSWNPDRFSKLEANHLADTNECAPTPENQHKSKSITSILSKKNKHHHKQDLIVKPTVNGNKSKNKGKSLLCGCVSRKSKKR
ncbi:rhoptry associated membrane antigen [Schistosoma japonicum]|nr:rhoptry associated membrane antigen [Schistosoma japonicum]